MSWVSIGSGNDLSPVRRKDITWSNADLLSIGPFETNFSEIRIKIQNVSFNIMHLNVLCEMVAILSEGNDLNTFTLAAHSLWNLSSKKQHYWRGISIDVLANMQTCTRLSWPFNNTIQRNDCITRETAKSFYDFFKWSVHVCVLNFQWITQTIKWRSEENWIFWCSWNNVNKISKPNV